MAVLGRGKLTARSLLHAAALGYGAAMALDLHVTVRLLDKPSKRRFSTAMACSRHFLRHGLLKAIHFRMDTPKMTSTGVSNPMFPKSRV